MLKIYLARHGQDQDNVLGVLNGHRDHSLTTTGIKQAEDLARRIKEAKLSFSRIYSSPLIRAHRTAEIIADTLGRDRPEVLAGLIERDFGIMTGKRKDEIEKLCAPDILYTETINYFLSPQGAETFPQLLDRASQILEVIKSRHDTGNILLVTHGDVGKMIYAAYYHLPWREVLTLFHFGNSDLLLLSPDSAPESAHVFKAQQFNS